jgi:hypothetical protein
MGSRLYRSSIAVMIRTQSVVCIYLPLVISRSRYIHDCIPRNGANINALQHYYFVSTGIVVDLPVNVKKAVALEILTSLLEELRSQSVNLRMRKRLNTILPAAIDGRHRVYGLSRQLENLLRRKGALLPFPLQIKCRIPSWVGDSRPRLPLYKCIVGHGHINLHHLETPYGYAILSWKTSTETGHPPPAATLQFELPHGHYPTACYGCLRQALP